MKCSLCGFELSKIPRKDIEDCQGITVNGHRESCPQHYMPRFGDGVDARPEDFPQFPSAGRPALLQERQKTHGSFALNAAISQKLKDVLYGTGVRPDDPIFCEALDMISLKESRICSGQAHYADHWRDIVGYAQLGLERCLELEEKKK